MNRVLRLVVVTLGLWMLPAVTAAENTNDKPNVEVATSPSGDTKATTITTKGDDGAPTTATTVTVITPPTQRSALTEEATDLLERFVGWLHGFFPEIDDTAFHWIACLLIIVLAIVLRHVIAKIIFQYLKRLAAKTETTLDDRLFRALEKPVAVLIMVLGIFAALTVLQVSPETDLLFGTAAQIAILAVVFWGIIRAGAALLDELETAAARRKLTVATFMPLIKKTLFVFAVVLGVLVVADSVGAPVRVFLTSLGIGGLAFALAAQDTIANLFGSFVVVVDQPFKVGDTVRIGAHVGTVEDIGLRSTKLRLVDKSVLVIPNKSVAAEAITNLARFSQRRVEQVLSFTYASTPEQLTDIVKDIRALILAEPDVDPTSVQAYFRDYTPSSLDVWLVYVTKTPDFPKSMELRQRLNLKFMEAAAKRGLFFAHPTQTVLLDGPVAKKLAARGTEERPAPGGPAERSDA